MAAARDDPHALADNMHSQAIAVPLHLESPVLACRWLALELREAGLDPIRHRVNEEIAFGLSAACRPIKGIAS